MRRYSLDEIERLLDPRLTPYDEYSSKAVSVIEFLLHEVRRLADELTTLRRDYAALAGVDVPSSEGVEDA